jgi:peroxiredoxin
MEAIMAHAHGPRDVHNWTAGVTGALGAWKGVARMTKPRLWGFSVLTIFVVMAPIAARGDNVATLFAQTPGQTIPSTLTVGSTAPPFRLTAIDGQQYNLATLRGTTVILFAMFASCADCIPQGQTLSRIRQAYTAKGVTVIGVDIVAGESEEALRQYQQVGHITIPLAAYSAEIVHQYRLVQPDMTYVIGRDGIIRYMNARALS